MTEWRTSLLEEEVRGLRGQSPGRTIHTDTETTQNPRGELLKSDRQSSRKNQGKIWVFVDYCKARGLV